MQLKEVLEKYLDDENDMKAMHLSGKLREHKAAAFRRLARRSLREGSLERATQSSSGAGSHTEQDMQAQLTADQVGDLIRFVAGSPTLFQLVWLSQLQTLRVKLCRILRMLRLQKRPQRWKCC